MIPGIMVDFLERASIAVAATRSGNRIPDIHLLSGWYVEENRETAVGLVAPGSLEGLRESLADNGHFALTAEVIGPHETYQFKGIQATSRPVTDAELAIHRDCRRRFLEAVRRTYPNRFPDEAVLARIPSPSLAVRFRVVEVYVQTPGPAAGRRLFPPEER